MVDNYLLRRDVHGSIRFVRRLGPLSDLEVNLFDCARLNAQHLLWRIYNGYVLNPAISRSGEMKIAEIGTGTGFLVSRPCLRCL